MKRLIQGLFITIIFMVTVVFAHQYQKDIIITGTDGPYIDSRAYTTLNDAVTAAGANERTIKIFESEVVTTLTIPATVTLEFSGDGAIANSGQLTINTLNIISEAKQIFTGAGDIDFTSGTVVKSSWFSDLDEALDVTNDDTLTMLITESETLTASAAVGNDVVLKWDSEFLITCSTFTLSNLKMVEAGTYQIFSSGAGDYDFLEGSTVKSSWFTNLRIGITFLTDENVNINYIIDQPEIIDADVTADEYFIFTFNAIVTPEVGDTLTVYSPEHIIASSRQQILDLTSNSTNPLLFTNPGIRSACWWGALGDGGTTDNVEEFQAAISSVIGGEVIVPEGASYYSHSSAIRMQNETVFRLETPATYIYADTSTAKWPLSANVLFGSYQENNRENLDDDDYALDAVSKADESVTTTTAGDAANFAVGDVVWIHSTTTFTYSATDFYTWGQLNVVVSATAGTGVVVLRHPMQEEGAALIANLSDNGDDFLYSDNSDTGLDNFATRDAKILGGKWENANSAGLASFMAAGGGIDNVVDIDSYKGTNSPAWGNLMAHTQFKVRRVHTFRRVVEMAMHSHNNIIEIDNIYCDASSTAATALLWFGEGSRNNTLRINKIVTDANDDTILRFNETRNNDVQIGTVEAPAITNSVVMFRTTTATGTPPNCGSNKVRILSSVTTAALSQYIVFDGDQTYRNMVYDSNFFGTLSGTPGVAINLGTTQADSHNTVRNSWFQDGSVYMEVGADGYILDGNRIPDGVISLIASDIASVANGTTVALAGAAGANDDLVTINGGVKGFTVTFLANDGADTITFKDSGNIKATAADFALDNILDRIVFEYNGTNWCEISRSNNGA